MALTLLSPWSPSVTRSLPWSVRALDAAGHNPLNPNDLAFYEDGEWLEDDGALGLVRGGTSVNAAETQMTAPSYQIFNERGRTDSVAQAGIGHPAAGGALTAGKITIMRMHSYEGTTDMWSGTVVGANMVIGVVGAIAAGSPLQVHNACAAAGVAPFRRCLGLVGAVTDRITAYAVQAPAANGQLRFIVV